MKTSGSCAWACASSSRGEGFSETPAYAIEKVLKKTGKRVEDIDLFEINEAFSAVALACEKCLGWIGGK